MIAKINNSPPDKIRRLLLLGSVSLLALNACMETFEDGPVPALTGAIDVHCHVFNASDVPVRGFVQRVVLGDQEEQRRPLPDPIRDKAVLPAFAALLVALLSSDTITADRELARLSRGDGDEAPPLPRVPFEKSLANTLEDILDAPGEAAGEIGGGRQKLRAQILSDAGIPLSAEQPDAQEVAEALLLSDSLAGRYFRWARLLMSSRTEIIAELNRLYGGPSRTVLFTPALVDFSLWLDGEPRSPLPSQITLMEALQRRSSVPIHGFAPFDPWRMARDTVAGRPDHAEWRALGETDPRELSALGLAQWAVEEMGFVGVKLYPPMGFRPAENTGADQTYPRRAIEEFPSDFPERIDLALDALYSWCEQEGVPIMAHASNSQGAADGYAKRANPVHWATVLAAHPSLRLSLAHFGDSLTVDEGGDTWDDAIGALLATGHAGIYADVSHHSEVLPRVGDANLSAQEAALRLYLDRYDPGAERLLFGTDWLMLGREPDHELFAARIAALLKAAGLDDDAQRRVFFKNAIDYLGLRAGEPTHERLRRYYLRTGLDFGRIAVLAAA